MKNILYKKNWNTFFYNTISINGDDWNGIDVYCTALSYSSLCSIPNFNNRSLTVITLMLFEM